MERAEEVATHSGTDQWRSGRCGGVFDDIEGIETLRVTRQERSLAPDDHRASVLIVCVTEAEPDTRRRRLSIGSVLEGWHVDYVWMPPACDYHVAFQFGELAYQLTKPEAAAGKGCGRE